MTEFSDADSFDNWEGPQHVYKSEILGNFTPTEPPADIHPVLAPTPPTDARKDLGEFLLAAVFAHLPKDATDVDFVEAVQNAASILWGAGYRKVLQ